MLVDVNEHANLLRELTKTTLVSNMTMFLAWSSPEAGRYLETFKTYEHTPPTAIQEKVSDSYSTRLVEVLTQIRSVNKTDAVSLVSTFGSMRAAVNARPEEIMMIGGWGPQKVARFDRAVHGPFRVRKSTATQKRTERVQPRTATDPRVAERLGIAIAPPVAVQNAVASNSRVAPEEIWDEEDEDALLAVMEAEAAAAASAGTRKDVVRDSTGPPGPAIDEGERGVLEALKKMREKASS